MESTPERDRWGIPLEIVGEIVLLAVVGGFFTYLFVESLGWPTGAALMPRIAVAIGVPFWIGRVAVLVRRTEAKPAQIMDFGFRVGVDPKAEARRFTRIVGFIVGLYIAIWIFGFHVALPLGMLFYLFVYGQLRWIWSIVVSLLFLALIVGVYDELLHANWHEPLISKIWPAR